jgi:hypothetical protein
VPNLSQNKESEEALVSSGSFRRLPRIHNTHSQCFFCIYFFQFRLT